MKKDDLDTIHPPMTPEALLKALNRAWDSYTQASTHGTRSAAQHAFKNARQQLATRKIAVHQENGVWVASGRDPKQGKMEDGRNERA